MTESKFNFREAMENQPSVRSDPDEEFAQESEGTIVNEPARNKQTLNMLESGYLERAEVENAQAEFRQSLRAQVQRAELSRVDAEAQWRAKTGTNLTVRPRYFDIKGGLLALWDIAMAASWVVWRDPAQVLRFVPQSYQGARIWSSNRDFAVPSKGRFSEFARVARNGGHTLVEFGKPEFDGSHGSSFIGYDGMRHSLDLTSAWMPKLQGYLVSGLIKSVGDAISGQRNDVAIGWQDWVGADWAIQGGQLQLVKNAERTFSNVRFIAQDVISAFKPANAVQKDVLVWKDNEKLKEILTETQFKAASILSRKGGGEFKIETSKVGVRNRNLMNQIMEDDPNFFADMTKARTPERFFERLFERKCFVESDYVEVVEVLVRTDLFKNQPSRKREDDFLT
ncbi:hypothetical protein J2Y63_004181 [Shinella sp. BE166]|uniref:hypothetical protein n=1 Tax=Shinella sp. BE166 TaxID=3373918 RepID=UPI003EBA3C08